MARRLEDCFNIKSENTRHNTVAHLRPLSSIPGASLRMLHALQAPNCPHDRIYVLPLLTIKTNKGTGTRAELHLRANVCQFA